MPSSTMAIRHSSGWSTLISISFFMRSIFLTQSRWRWFVNGPSTAPGARRARPPDRRWPRRDAGWRRARTVRSGSQLPFGASQDGSLSQEVAQAEDVDYLFGPGGAAWRHL